MKIVTNYSILRQKSKPIESVDEALKIIAYLEEALAQTNNGVGLAAIQLGIPKRVGVIKIDDKSIYLINTEIVEATKKTIFVDEGCLSLPGQYMDTIRYQDYMIQNDVIDEGKFRKEIWCNYYSPDPTEPGNDGLSAIAIQHEMDHFEGKLIVDHNVTRKPIITEAKVGRNDPCPCGSGKKYKKCCLR